MRSPRPRRTGEALKARVTRRDDGVARLQSGIGTRPDARLWKKVRAGSVLIVSEDGMGEITVDADNGLEGESMRMCTL